MSASKGFGRPVNSKEIPFPESVPQVDARLRFSNEGDGLSFAAVIHLGSACLRRTSALSFAPSDPLRAAHGREYGSSVMR